MPAASALGIDRVMVFPQSAVFSAFGGGLLPVAHSYHAAVPDVGDAGPVSQALGAIVDRARRDLRAEGVTITGEVLASVALHDFAGRQAAAALPFLQLADDPAAAVVALPGSGPGRLAVSIRAAGTPRLRAAGLAGGAARAGAGPGRRTVRFAGGIQEVPVSGGLGRPHAPPVPGPAFLEAPDTTVFVPAGWTAEFDALGYGLLHRQMSEGQVERA